VYVSSPHPVNFFLQTVNVKVIRNKQTGQSDGYGFVEFQTHAMAEYVLHNWSGAQMLNAEQSKFDVA
jgi:hypothetical protein